MSTSRILVFGDSHTQALKNAHKHRGGSSRTAHIRILRFSNVKSRQEIGDVSIDTATSMVAESPAHDLIASAIGGNQHQVLGLVQHPMAFDFIEPGALHDSQPCVLIPYHTM